MRPRIKVYRIADRQWSIRKATAYDKPSLMVCCGSVGIHFYRKKLRK